jgi:hypothetical protein
MVQVLTGGAYRRTLALQSGGLTVSIFQLFKSFQNMKKYRPYFTLDELKFIHSTLFTQSQIHPITRYLEKYISDIDRGFLSPQLVLSPKQSMEEKLELFDPPKKSAKTKTEFEVLQEARYLNNEMSPEEEDQYEEDNGISF